MKKILVAAVFLLFPALVFAAGFAKQTLFLSKSSVTEGETVLIHAIVSNEAITKFTGKLEISDQGENIGTVPVSLAAGEAAAVSVSWKPGPGSHTIDAQLHDNAGNIVETESATFSILPKQKPVAANTANEPAPVSAIDSSKSIQEAIANISPGVANGSQPIFSTIDSARTSVAKALDSGVAWSKQQIAQSITSKNNGKILGTETQKNAATSTAIGGITSTAWMIFATVALYFLSILRHLIGSAGIFYPLFAILFLFILWKFYRRFRRRR